jgi:hypothetical protein
MSQIAQDLLVFLPGWKAYFHLAQTPNVWRRLDEWLRHHLRAARPCAVARLGHQPRRGGSDCRQRSSPVAQQRSRPASGALHRVLLPSWGSPPVLISTSRAARCGPACRAVWQGSGLR